MLDSIPELSPTLKSKDGDGPVEESHEETMEEISNTAGGNMSPRTIAPHEEDNIIERKSIDVRSAK